MWAHKVESVQTSRFIFIDESGAKTTMTRLYGRGFDGARVFDHVPHGYWCTTTMVAGIGLTGANAPFVFEGAMDSEAFRAYVEHVLAPQLKAGDIVVLDNLKCHADLPARQLIERAGAQVWFLPPYCPDLNPIEKMWSKVKAILRTACARTQEALYQAIGYAFACITADDASGWIKSCGYNI